MVKDFSWNINPWNALLFEKTLKQLSILDYENYGFVVNTCHDTAKSNSNILVRNYYVPKNYITSEGAVSHNVLYYQPLPIIRYQVRVHANNYFE